LSLFEIIALAVALGIDCLVVSFSQGLVLNKSRTKNSFALATTMGLCQGIMPCFAYFGTEIISRFIAPYSKWLVLAIFMTLGLKFIVEAFEEKEEEICCINFKCLIAMGIATSIDAFASGVTLKLTHTPLAFSALLIGVMSFVMSCVGFWLAVFFKKLPSKFLEITGGAILIGMAIKAIL
jgi:putative Mn2+ efflux pump MntP